MFFCLLIISIANFLPATNWSPVNNKMFKLVFGNTILAVGASMLAYLCAQLIDIRIYHFWKKLTKRNTCGYATMVLIFSQLVDTFNYISIM